MLLMDINPPELPKKKKVAAEVQRKSRSLLSNLKLKLKRIFTSDPLAANKMSS